MALIKCKECGEQVSSKAITCPKCGAKSPKKTSPFIWVMLILIIFVFYALKQSPTPTGNAARSKQNITSLDPSQKAETATKTRPPRPSWSTSISKDEMTGKLAAFAHSPISVPSKRMSFPYNDVNAWLGVGCDGDNEWAYIGFNSAPNLANDETEDGYNVINTRIRWNSKIENVVLTQDWGAKFLHFRNDSSAISKIVASSSALLELQWHGEQPTYFKFSLNGSSKALSEIRAKCLK